MSDLDDMSIEDLLAQQFADDNAENEEETTAAAAAKKEEEPKPSPTGQKRRRGALSVFPRINTSDTRPAAAEPDPEPEPEITEPEEEPAAEIPAAAPAVTEAPAAGVHIIPEEELDPMEAYIPEEKEDDADEPEDEDDTPVEDIVTKQYEETDYTELFDIDEIAPADDDENEDLFFQGYLPEEDYDSSYPKESDDNEEEPEESDSADFGKESEAYRLFGGRYIPSDKDSPRRPLFRDAMDDEFFAQAHTQDRPRTRRFDRPSYAGNAPGMETDGSYAARRREEQLSARRTRGWANVSNPRIPRNRFTVDDHYREEVPEIPEPREVFEAAEAVKSAQILAESAAPVQTAQQRMIDLSEDVLLTLNNEVVHEKHLPQVRKFDSDNKAVIEAPRFAEAKKDQGKKPLLVLFLIFGFIAAVAAGFITNAYHFHALNKGQNVTALQCLVRGLIPEMGGEYKFAFLPLDTDYFFAGAGFVAGVFIFIGAIAWVTMTTNEQSRVGHEHGEKHIATPTEVASYRNKYME